MEAVRNCECCVTITGEVNSTGALQEACCAGTQSMKEDSGAQVADVECILQFFGAGEEQGSCPLQGVHERGFRGAQVAEVECILQIFGAGEEQGSCQLQKVLKLDCSCHV